MVGIGLPLLFVLSMSHTFIDAIACKGGAYTISATPPLDCYDIECTGPQYEDLCYMKYSYFNDRYHNHMYGFILYGCLEKGSLYRCNQTSHGGILDTYECCCMRANCNMQAGSVFNSCGRNGLV